MRLLIDMNLSPRWVGWLTDAGIEAAHWSTMGLRVVCRVATLVSLLVPLGAAAVDTSLDELQRRLDAARAHGTAPAASAPRAPAARRAATAVLLVQTDTPCALSIDGKQLGPLREAETRQLSVPAGPARIECRSDLDPSAHYQLDDRFEGGTRTIVKMTLAAAVESAHLRRAAAAASSAASAEAPRRSAGAAPVRSAPSASGAGARPRPDDEWAAARASLARDNTDPTLASSLRALLQVDQPDDLDTLARFDAMVSHLRWKSAVAVGQRNGYLVFAYSYSFTRPDWAADSALGTCQRHAERPCHVVMADSRFAREPLIDTAARLGAQPRAAVRTAMVKDMRVMLEKAP